MTRVRTPKMNYMEERKSVWGEAFKSPKNKKTRDIDGMNMEFKNVFARILNMLDT